MKIPFQHKLPESLKKRIKSLRAKIINRRILKQIIKDKAYKVYHHKPVITMADPVKKLSFKKNDHPLVSIIIPVYNQWYYTYSCLLSILHHTKDIDYEIILADDGSKDETQNIQAVVENIKVIRNKENLGFIKNCHHASGFAIGKYILFLNNDTNVQQDWLKYLVKVMEKDQSAGIVGPKFLSPNGRIQEAGGIIWQDGSSSHYGYGDTPGKPEYNYVKETDYISGAGLMIRKPLWDTIGGFDEQFAPFYYEDTDLAFAARKYGYKVVYQPKSMILHFEGATCGTAVNTESKQRMQLNKEKFLEKWRKVLEKEHFEKGNSIFVARDRSSSKKTILVYDDGEPCLDEKIKKMSEMGVNIKVLRKDFSRYEPYTSNLEQSGVEVLYGYWYHKNIKRWLKDNGKYLDCVYLEKHLPTGKYSELIKRNSKAKIFHSFDELLRTTTGAEI
jgi:GT2 family glycosyltransferase